MRRKIKRTNKIILILGVLLVVSILYYVSEIIFNWYSKPVIKEATATIVPKPTIFGWETFISKRFGYAFNYPSDWDSEFPIDFSSSVVVNRIQNIQESEVENHTYPYEPTEIINLEELAKPFVKILVHVRLDQEKNWRDMFYEDYLNLSRYKVDESPRYRIGDFYTIETEYLSTPKSEGLYYGKGTKGIDFYAFPSNNKMIVVEIIYYDPMGRNLFETDLGEEVEEILKSFVVTK